MCPKSQWAAVRIKFTKYSTTNNEQNCGQVPVCSRNTDTCKPCASGFVEGAQISLPFLLIFRPSGPVGAQKWDGVSFGLSLVKLVCEEG